MPRTVRSLLVYFVLGSVIPVLASAPCPLPQQKGGAIPETFQVAVGMQQRGLHDEAARQFAAFIKQQPRHRLVAEANYRLGVSQIELGGEAAAIQSLQRALQAGGAAFALRPECRYRLGNLLQAGEQTRAAAVQFEALGQELAEGHYLVAAAAFAAGECQRDLGDDTAAAAAFARAVEAATGEQQSFRFPALYQIGFCLLRREALAEAAEVFGLAELAAGDAAARGECRYLQGDTLLRLERLDEAERALRSALEVESEFRDDAAFGLGWVAVGRDDHEQARAAFASFLRDHAKSPLAGKARLELGRTMYRLQQYEPAAKVLEPLVAAGAAAELQQQARELRGLCALASGAGEAAVTTLQLSLQNAAAADKPRLSFALGEALANLERWSEAVAAYSAVPADAGAELYGDATYGVCFALHQLGNYDESIVRARVVQALQPRHRLHDDAAFAIAENFFLSKRYRQAKAAYGKLGQGAFAYRAQWKLAWCHYLDGDREAAAVAFARLAKVDGEFAEEALSMEALSRFETGDAAAALAAADRYLARHREGAFLDRTERIAARVLRQRGDLASAQKRLQRAAKMAAARQQDVRGDQLEQAEIAYQQGDFKAAIGLFATLSGEAGVIGARAIAGQAWCAFELGDDGACAQLLQRGLAHAALGDEAAGLLELQSALQHRRQDWPAAIATAQTFLERYAQHDKAAAIRFALGVAQARAGEHGAARATLAQLERDGKHADRDRVLYELAWACRRDGDEQAAVAAFGRCLEATKDEELAGECRLHLGTAALATDGGLGQARGLLEAVTGSYRGRALYRLGFAEFEAAGDDHKALAQARNHFDAIAAMDGESLVGEALFLAAECCQRLGDARGAVQRTRRLLELAPAHERADRARLVLGECAVQLGDGDLAVPALEQYLRQQDRQRVEQARAYLALGRARFLRGENDRAEAAFVEVTQRSEGPLAAEAQFRIGETRQKASNLQGAVEAYVKLPILYAHAEWVRRGLLQAGLVYEQLQQPEKSKRILRELIEQHPDSEEAAVAKKRLRDD